MAKDLKLSHVTFKTAHDMSASDYRKQFDIPRSQSLAAKNYSESRRQMAVDRGLADNLAKARAAPRQKIRHSNKKGDPDLVAFFTTPDYSNTNGMVISSC